ncbi:MAG: hypothetical protein ACRBBQ_00555 [Cognatishimia sp.]
MRDTSAPPRPQPDDCNTPVRAGIFSDYRLKVVQVLRGYGMTDRAAAPDDSL